MAAISYNLEIDQGASHVFAYDWISNSTGLPLDLTDYSAKMQIRSGPGDEQVLLELSSTNGRISMGGATGEVLVVFQPADTENIDWYDAYYDLFLTNTVDASKTRLAKGFVTILRKITG
jgi:hypothetical protein